MAKVYRYRYISKQCSPRSTLWIIITDTKPVNKFASAYFLHRYSPFGIMFLIATKFIEMEDPTRVFEQLLYYFLTVLAGLAIHGLIFLPLIYFIATRKNPYLFLFRQMKAIITAWGTASRWRSSLGECIHSYLVYRMSIPRRALVHTWVFEHET